MIKFCNPPILLFVLMYLATLNLFKRVTASAYPFAGSACPTQYLCSQVVGWMKVLVFFAAVWPCITLGEELYNIDYCDSISWNNNLENGTYKYTINLEEVRSEKVCIILRATKDDNNFKFMWWKENVPFTYLKFYKNNLPQCEFIGNESQSKTYSIKEGDELKWVFGIMSSVPKGRAWVALPSTVTTSCPALNITVSDNTHCVNQTNMMAEISGIRDATYYQWSVTSGDIVSGQGTPSILWNAGDDDTVIEVNVLRSNSNDATCSYRKVIPVNRTCVYLNCHDNINNHIENNTQIRLSGGCRYEGDVKIEGIHDLSIKPAGSDSKPEIYGHFIIYDSKKITISGLHIIGPNHNPLISTDNLNNSNILNNQFKSESPYVYIFLSRSHRINVKNNNFMLCNNKTPPLITLDNCTLINISDNIYPSSYKVYEKLYRFENLYDISCVINTTRNCYICKYFNMSSCDLKTLLEISQSNWADLDAINTTCN